MPAVSRAAWSASVELLEVAPQVVDHALLLLVDDESEAGTDDDAEAHSVEDIFPFGFEVGTMEHDVEEGYHPGGEHGDADPYPAGTLLLQANGFLVDLLQAEAVEVIGADVLHETLVIDQRDGNESHGGQTEPDGQSHGAYEQPGQEYDAEDHVHALDLAIEADALEARLHGLAHQFLVDDFLAV